jgi:hypothetical protein
LHFRKIRQEREWCIAFIYCGHHDSFLCGPDQRYVVDLNSKDDEHISVDSVEGCYLLYALNIMCLNVQLILVTWSTNVPYS